MKNVVMAMAIASLAGSACADVYMDNTGDLNAFFGGFDHLDIVQVEVTNDASFLYFDITMAGDLDATNWGNYVVGLDTGANAGDNSVDPGSWNRNVDWGRGITDFIGSWANDGGSGAGAELRSYDGSMWNLTDATYLGGGLVTASDAGHAAGVQSVAVSLAALGLSVGDTIEFDVFTTGGVGTPPGVDHLSLAGEATPNWDTQSAAGQFLGYTIVPAPSSLAMLGLGGLVAGRRRR